MVSLKNKSELRCLAWASHEGMKTLEGESAGLEKRCDLLLAVWEVLYRLSLLIGYLGLTLTFFWPEGAAEGEVVLKVKNTVLEDRWS